MNTPGRLIVFEGADEVGKTTFVEAATEHFRRCGERVRQLAFPGRDVGTLGAHVYGLHHSPQKSGITTPPTAASIQLLHIASHVDALERMILPALEAGETIVLDRYWWSTWVYGLVAGADNSLLTEMIAVEKTCWGAIRPDMILLVSRSEPLNSVPDIGEWRRISREYEALGNKEKGHQRVVFISNDRDMQSALRAVLVELESLSRFAQNASKPARSGMDTLSGPQSDSLSAPLTLDLFTTVAAPGESIPRDLQLFHVHAALAPTVPTDVYETYWRFAAERQAIFFRKQSTLLPWTDDPILFTHKFTNAYRASDRVSQYLIRNVIYSGDQTPKELFFRILLFKTFNRIETWELLTKYLGTISWEDYTFTKYDQLLTQALASGDRIYSGAYIMSSARTAFGSDRKHRNHLQLIEAMMRADVPARVVDARSMKEVFELLISFPSIGGFLAYQYTIDLNYSPLTNFSEMEFVVPGPGAKDGLRKCFAHFGGLSEADLIRRVADLQEQEFDRLGLTFKSLWGRRLQLIDCQNLFCEVDKYARVAHPSAAGITGRTRIKQKYRPGATRIDYWYPPKWGLNELISQGAEGVSNI